MLIDLTNPATGIEKSVGEIWKLNIKFLSLQKKLQT